MTNPRLGKLFATSGMKELLKHLRQRLENGDSLERGSISIGNPSPELRHEIHRFFGRPDRRNSGRLNIDLDKLNHILNTAGLANNAAEAVAILTGPWTDRKRSRQEEQKRWRQFFEDITSQIESDFPSEACAYMKEAIQDANKTGLLKRWSDGDLEHAKDFLYQFMNVMRHLPAQTVSLAELAALSTGDSHALDSGKPLGSLCLRLLSIRLLAKGLNETTDRRLLWESVGIVCDELSAPVLALNIRSTEEGLLGLTLSRHAELGEPLRLTLRQLRKFPFKLQPEEQNPRVFICENPNVLASVAEKLGPRSATLICLDGQPKSAGRALLRIFQQYGARFFYHGDFDGPGLQIANLIIEEFQAQPWRMSVHDYILGLSCGTPLDSKPPQASWDSELAERMIIEGKAVHEESLIDLLLEDLERVGR